MEEKVAVFGFLRFPAEAIASVWPHLNTVVEATRSLDGCIGYDVAEYLYEPGLIRFSELWPSQEALDAHLAAKKITPWREAARAHGLMDRQFTAYAITAARRV